MKNNNLIMMMAFFAVSVILFGCAQQQTAPQKNETAQPEDLSKIPVPAPTPQVMPEPIGAPADEPPAVVTEDKTLGNGEQAIKESEIPAYNESKDKELEDLMEELDK